MMRVLVMGATGNVGVGAVRDRPTSALSGTTSANAGRLGHEQRNDSR